MRNLKSTGVDWASKKEVVNGRTLHIRFTDNNGNVVLSATGTAMGRRIEVEDQ